MNCPVCKTVSLAPRTLEEGLSAMGCGTCGGEWLPGNAYRAWRESHSDDLPERPVSDAEASALPVSEDHKGRLCPECGGLILPYHVGHGMLFSLEHCVRCGGTWFEENEYALLRAANLHDNLHQIFTQPWQEAVARAERAREHERNLRARFGDTDYEKAQDFKAWVNAHPHRAALLAFLTYED